MNNRQWQGEQYHSSASPIFTQEAGTTSPSAWQQPDNQQWIVLESLVQSGFLAQKKKTEIETSPDVS